MTQNQKYKLDRLIEGAKTQQFYSWSCWRRVREKVLKMDNYECQMCKREGKYAKGYIVHHVKHLEDRPDLALSIFDDATGERQLITVCKEHHELEHPEALSGQGRKRQSGNELTAERWD